MWFVFSLLVTDSYYVKNLFGLYFAEVLLMFSVYGFADFLVMFIKAVILQIFGKSIPILFDFVIIFGLLCYFLAIFSCAHHFSKLKSLKSFLAKVSFSLCGKHIEITGLLDSGNSLYDSKTGKAVIVVSVSVLKKVLPKTDFKRIENGDFSNLPISHYLNYVSVGGNSADMPVIDIGNAFVEVKHVSKKVRCVLGLALQDFDSTGSFECLLHRDFV